MRTSTAEILPDDASTDPLARTHILLNCFSAITEEAIDALSNGRLAAVDDALRAREDMVPLLDELLRIANQPTTGTADLDGLHHHLRIVQELDTRFRISLEAESQRVSREIELLDNEEAVLSAYGHLTHSGGRTIDFVR